MRKFKRVLCVALALSMIVSVTACGKKDKDSGGSSSVTMTSDEMKNYVFKEEPVNIANADGNSNIFVSNGKMYVTEINYNYADYVEDGDVELYSDDTAILRDLDENVAEDEAVAEETVDEEAMTDDADAALTDANAEAVSEGDGSEGEDVEEGNSEETLDLTITCLSMDGQKEYEYKNVYPINNSVYNFTVDKAGNMYFLNEAYGYDDQTGTYNDNYNMVCIDSKGVEQWEQYIGGTKTSEEFWIQNLYSYGEGIMLVTNNGSIKVAANGNIETIAAAQNDNQDVGSIITTTSGRAIACVYDMDGTSYYDYNMETGKVGEKLDLPALLISGNVYSSTISDFAISNMEGVFTYSFGDAAPKKIMDYIASDMSINSLHDIVFEDENTFYAGYYDGVKGNEVYSKFTKVDPSQVKDKTVISIGGLWIDTDVRNKVVEYNKASDTTKILIKDYSSDVDDFNQMISNFNTAIATGNIPDIIICSNELNFDNYAEKGLFADLNPLLENDSEINKSDFMQNILEMCSQKGKLYGLCPSFYISTVYAKKSIVGDKTSWTMDEFNKISKEFGNGKTDWGIFSKADFISMAFNYNAEKYVDWETGKVSIDTPEFIALLKYTENLPLEIDYDSDEVNDFWNSYETMYIENRSLAYTSTIYSLRDYNYTEQIMFREPVTAIGFPTDTGCGSTINTNLMFAISSKTKHADAAWDFVREFFTDDYQQSISGGLPVRISARDAVKKLAQEKPFYMDGDKKVYYDDTYFVNGEEVILTPPTDAQIDEVFAFAETLTTKYSYNANINDLVNEEAQAYYTGQKSAEDVAKVIQKRVQIYVDEHR